MQRTDGRGEIVGLARFPGEAKSPVTLDSMEWTASINSRLELLAQPLVLRSSVFLLALSLLAAIGCGGDAGGGTGRDPTEAPANETDEPATDPGQPLLAQVLGLVPDTAGSRELVVIDNLATRRRVLGVERPGANAGQDALLEYLLAMVRMPNGELAQPLTFGRNQWLTGLHDFVGEVDLRPYLGFDLRDSNRSVRIGQDDQGFLELTVGMYDPSRTEAALAGCAQCAEPRELVHHGVAYWTWGESSSEDDSRAFAPPIFDHQGRSGFVWIADGMAARSFERDGLEALIATAEGVAPSIFAQEDYQLAVDALGGRPFFDAVFTNQTYDTGEAVQTLETFGDALRRRLSPVVEDIPAIVYSPRPLRPYRLHASIAGFESGKWFVVNALVHEDEGRATVNAKRLEERLREGIRLNKKPWSDFYSDFEVRAEGRLVIAEFKGREIARTALRLLPSPVGDGFTAHLFSHEEEPR